MNHPGSSRSLDEWLAWLETLTPNEIELGLERVGVVLSRLNLKPAGRTIVVAGTNGKGSSVAMLESLYLTQSQSVGCYTSPHIHRYNERIRIAGVDVSDDQIVDSFLQVEAARQDTPLTYFEYGTLAAFCLFDTENVETQVLEVGLGGRLDAVNAVEPDGCLITNVSLDHCSWLGSDVDSIAFEKAGVMRSGKPCVFAGEDRPAAIDQFAVKSGADLRCAGEDFRSTIIDPRHWRFEGREVVLDPLEYPSMRGRFQIRNAAGVLALIEAMGDKLVLTQDNVDAALGTVEVPGRCQVIERGRRWVVDVAHNADAARALAIALREMGIDGGMTCIIGVLNDKDIPGMLDPLLPLVDNWIAVSADGPRAVPAEELGRVVANFADQPCLIADSIADACAAASNGYLDSKPVLVTGSFMTIGPALDWLQQNPDSDKR